MSRRTTILNAQAKRRQNGRKMVLSVLNPSTFIAGLTFTFNSLSTHIVKSITSVTPLDLGETGTVLERRCVEIIKITNDVAEWLKIGHGPQQLNACVQETVEIMASELL